MEGSSEMLRANGPYKVLEKNTQFLDLEASNNSQSLTSTHYFLDDEELHLDASIDPYARPPRGIADKLLDCYFTTVHPSFPIIAKIPFMQQYEMYYTQPELQPTRQWLTVLHLVFAISSKFAQLSSKPWVCEAASSIVCFARAWKLSVIESQLLDHPNLQQAQAEGLMAFFLMSIGHTTAPGGRVVLHSDPQSLWASICTVRIRRYQICQWRFGTGYGGLSTR
jgi:hypothetical protein